MFRVGGEEAIGPGSSRGGAERGEPPILHAWARVPSRFPASLSAPRVALPSLAAPRLWGRVRGCCRWLAVVRAVAWVPRAVVQCLGSWTGRPPWAVLRLRDVTRALGCVLPPPESDRNSEFLQTPHFVDSP